MKGKIHRTSKASGNFDKYTYFRKSMKIQVSTAKLEEMRMAFLYKKKPKSVL